MPLTVLAIADEVNPALYDHFQRTRWDHIDLILSSGDLPPDYLDFLCSSLNIPVFYVRGNHDSEYDRSRYDGCDNLHGRMVEFKGVRFAGFEGCMRYNDGAAQYSEGQMKRCVKRMQLQVLRHGKPHVLLTHAPPAGCHDGQDVCHRGFDAFNHAMDIWKPSFLVHGHTHAHYGREHVTSLGGTTVINAFPYRVFEIPVPVAESRKAAPVRSHVAFRRLFH